MSPPLRLLALSALLGSAQLARADPPAARSSSSGKASPDASKDRSPDASKKASSDAGKKAAGDASKTASSEASKKRSIDKAKDTKAPARADKPKPPPVPPQLLLTFDDGPSLERTPRVLDTLEKYGVHAVFFVNGVHFQGTSASAEKARALLREEVARGHAVGNHTVHHYFLCGKVYSKRATEEIEDNATLIEQAIGKRPELYRTPYGAHCPALAATLSRLGIKHTGWDIDPQDWKVLNTNKVRDYVTHYLHNMKSGRQILLMHDIHQDTVEALPQILEFLKGENAERVRRGDPPIRIVDYAYLLPPRRDPPFVPPVIEGIGRILIEQVGTAPLRDVGAKLSRLPGKGPRS